MLKPFKALRPAPEFVAQCAAPLYDVINSQDAKAYAKGNPFSFLHITKAEIDLADDVNPYDKAVYACAQNNLQKLIDEKVLQRDENPAYYIYRITTDNHQQTGLVAAASTQAYVENKIRKHERTRPDKEDDRVNLAKALNAQISPVFTTFIANQATKSILETLTQSEPCFQVTAHDGSEHCLWQINNSQDINNIDTAFNNLDVIYMADGHHRTEAAVRIAQENPQHNHFLAVQFPDDEVKIEGYHRIVKDLNGATADEFVEKLKTDFSISPMQKAELPKTKNNLGMYLSGQWYKLKLNSEPNTKDGLDVSLLTQYIIEPHLGITDARADKRIDYVGGGDSLEKLESRVNSGEMAVAFTLYPTSVKEMINIADQGFVMPPKTTWFEPKLIDGLIAYLYD